jgi:hydrogenase-4 membrane subunit HyfE
VEAHALHSQVLSTISAEKTPYFYAFLLLNGIPLELELGMSHDVIQMHMEISRSIFTGMNNEANMLFREISVGRLAMY